MDLNIYTKPNPLIENFEKFELPFDSNSFDPDFRFRESPDFRRAVNLRIDTNVLSD